MSMIFIDSSVIVESLKGNEKAVELLRSLDGNPLAINPIVFSEVVYIFMKYAKEDYSEQGFRLARFLRDA